jgi:Effector Associated Constant Component 1
MATNLIITIADAGPDDLRALRAWLVQEDELRGHVAIVQDGSAPGTLGVALEVLSVSLGSGGAGSVLVAGTMAWMRQQYAHRHPAGVVKLRLADGSSLEIPANTLRDRSPAEIGEWVHELAEALSAGDTPPEASAQAP